MHHGKKMKQRLKSNKDLYEKFIKMHQHEEYNAEKLDIDYVAASFAFYSEFF